MSYYCVIKSNKILKVPFSHTVLISVTWKKTLFKVSNNFCTTVYLKMICGCLKDHYSHHTVNKLKKCSAQCHLHRWFHRHWASFHLISLLSVSLFICYKLYLQIRVQCYRHAYIFFFLSVFLSFYALFIEINFMIHEAFFLQPWLEDFTPAQ